MKHVFLVDEDVDIFDMSDVMWAMTTRFQGDVDFIPIPGVHTHVLDPSNDPAYNPFIRVHGIACKAIFDCTVPYTMKEDFVRQLFFGGGSGQMGYGIILGLWRAEYADNRGSDRRQRRGDELFFGKSASQYGGYGDLSDSQQRSETDMGAGV